MRSLYQCLVQSMQPLNDVGTEMETDETPASLRQRLTVAKGLGGFEHGAAATSFGQGGSKVVSQGVGQLDQALGASQIAEVGVGKFCDGPVGGIGEVAHIRFLEHLVELGEMMESRLQNTSSPSKLKNVSNCQHRTKKSAPK